MNIQQHEDLKSTIWEIANRLRGPYRPPQYRLVRLPAIEEIMRAGWPARKDRLGRAILAVTLRRGGYDIADGAKANGSNIAKREYHHLYPVALLGEDRDSPNANRAVNCALITWRTNRRIAANSPKDYIEERAEVAVLGMDEVRSRLASHLVPFDALLDGDYYSFVEERSKLVHQIMHKLCAGESV